MCSVRSFFRGHADAVSTFSPAGLVVCASNERAPHHKSGPAWSLPMLRQSAMSAACPESRVLGSDTIIAGNVDVVLGMLVRSIACVG